MALAQHNFSSVNERGELLKQKHPNSLTLRKLLLQSYLHQEKVTEAERELEFLKKWEAPQALLFFEAWRDFILGRWLQTEVLLTRLEKQGALSADAILLQAKLAIARGFLTQAEPYLESYAGLAGKNEDWYLVAGMKWFQEKPLNAAAVSRFLAAYGQAHPNSANFFFLSATFEGLKGNWERALAAIDKALYFKANLEYLKKKRELLFRSGAITKTLSFLQRTDWQAAQEKRKSAFLSVFLHFYRQKERGEFWRVRQPVQLLPFLEQHWNRPELHSALSLFFLEELTRNNYGFRAPFRNTLSLPHRVAAQQALENADYSRAAVQARRAVLIAPQNPENRLLYGETFKWRSLPQSYLRELELAKSLMPSPPFALTVKIARLQQTQENSLKNRFTETLKNAPSTFSAKPKLAVPLSSEDWQTHYPIPYRSVLLSQGLFVALAASATLNAVQLPQGEIKKLLAPAPLFDYALSWQFLAPQKSTPLKEAASLEAFSIKVRLFKAGKEAPLEEKAFSANGSSAYPSLVNALVRWIEGLLPVRGQILALEADRALVSLGSRQGLSPTSQIFVDPPPANTPPALATSSLGTSSLGPYSALEIEEDLALFQFPAAAAALLRQQGMRVRFK